jgi:outer membrane protein, multidrug efflux system
MLLMTKINNHMRKSIIYFLAGFLLLGVAGCMVGGKFQSPVETASTPAKYAQVEGTSDSAVLIKWFELYEDTVLLRYIRTTLDSNRNMLRAAARIEQSREIAGIVKANLYPSFGYNASAGGGTAGTDAQKVGGGIDNGSFKMYGTMNWELDVWGKLRSANMASYNDFLADIENRNALMVSLVGEVASQYFLLIDLDNRLAIARQTLASRKESTRIITARFDKGYTSEIDKLQAEQQEAIAAASIPSFERQIVTVQNSLRTLMGMPPGQLERGIELYAQKQGPQIPEGLPSQLLTRRPDIRQAEKSLEAQFNRIGVAKANLYPSISLTAALGFASPSLTSLISGSGLVANGFGNLVGPIFEFQKNKRRIRVEEYRTKEISHTWEQTVLEAFADVDNSLAEYRTYTQELEIRKAQTIASRKALELTRARYDFGYSSYYEVLIQENYLFDAELAESLTTQRKLVSLVNLYKALGGGWQP